MPSSEVVHDSLAPTADAHTIDAAAPTTEPGNPPPPAVSDELSWRPQGGQPRYALTVETDPAGGGKVRLCFSTSRAAMHDVAQARAEADGRARSRVLDLLQGAPEYQRLIALRPQYRAACEEARKAEIQLRQARDRHAALARMVPPPPNLASRLANGQVLVEQAEAEAKAREAELSAITPVYRQAEAAVRETMPQLCQ
jgi:hypothetical protein